MVLLNDQEINLLIQTVKECKDLQGDMAEVGCYCGGSTKVICAMAPDKIVHVFDTFKGLPYTEGSFHQSHYTIAKEVFLQRMEGLTNFEVYEGLFPDTANPIKDEEFCFVHLDCDLSKSIMDGVNFFWPKMVKGGKILIHDSHNQPVKGLLEEFFKIPVETNYLCVTK